MARGDDREGVELMAGETLPKVCPDCKTETLEPQGPSTSRYVNPLAPYVLVCERCDHVFQWRSGSAITQLRRTE